MVFEIPKFIGTAKIILFVISILITSLSIQIGSFLNYIFSEELTKWIGAGFLMLMGLWIIYQALSSKKDTIAVLDTSPTIYQFMIRFLGITIQIIRDPIFSDLDRSKKIDWKEAIYLGVCLSIDSVCIGICSSMIGEPSYLFPILVATFQLLFLSFGRMLGKKLSCILQIPENIWNTLSGVLLICIGVSRFFM